VNTLCIIGAKPGFVKVKGGKFPSLPEVFALDQKRETAKAGRVMQNTVDLCH